MIENYDKKRSFVVANCDFIGKMLKCIKRYEISKKVSFMDELLSEMIVAVVVAVLGYVIGYMKERQINNKIEDTYVKYKLFFDVSGSVLKTVDEPLYKEVEEAITKMKTAYESDSFTIQAFNEIVKECADVFNRAQTLIKNRG